MHRAQRNLFAAKRPQVQQAECKALAGVAVWIEAGPSPQTGVVNAPTKIAKPRAPDPAGIGYVGQNLRRQRSRLGLRQGQASDSAGEQAQADAAQQLTAAWHGVRAGSGGGGLQKGSEVRLLQGVLHHVNIALGEGGLAVGQVKLPNTHETLVKPALQHLRPCR